MEISIVVCGWHFKNQDFYHKLINETKYFNNITVKYFVASHKKSEEADSNFLNTITQLGWKILYFKNEGWDWGAYQQFLLWQKDNDSFSDYYLFLHDDIEIKKNGFVQAFLDKIQQGVCVVANGSATGRDLKLKQIHPEDVLWAKINGFQIKSENCNTVRGSCIFTTKDVTENILIKMPIKKGKNIFAANSSLRIFAGLVRDRFGEKSVAYIGDKTLSSVYIEEGYRGNNGMPVKNKIISTLHPYINKTKIIYAIRRILRLKKAPPVKRGAGLKINLGCGQYPLLGYFNVDINSKYADMDANIMDVEFEHNTAAQVLMVHVIEHIDSLQVIPLFRKIYSWLKDNGQLVLEFPDIIKVCKHILKRANSFNGLQNSKFGLRGLYGKPVEGMTVHDYHKWGWTKTNISPILKDIGFRKIYVERTDFHTAKRDIRIVAVK